MNMLIQLSVALAIVAFVYAGDEYGSYKVERQNVGSKYFSSGKYYYGGVYSGKCGNDGLYYKNAESFVICSNGNSYVQPCAPGTRNSGHNSFHAGSYYEYSHFCDVNLNDYGYGSHGYHNAPAAPHYGQRHEGQAYHNAPAYHDSHSDGYNTGYGVNKHAYQEEKHYEQERYQSHQPYHAEPKRPFSSYEHETSYKAPHADAGYARENKVYVEKSYERKVDKKPFY